MGINVDVTVPAISPAIVVYAISLMGFVEVYYVLQYH